MKIKHSSGPILNNTTIKNFNNFVYIDYLWICENCGQPYLCVAVQTEKRDLCLLLNFLPQHTPTLILMHTQGRGIGVKLTPCDQHDWVISIIQVALGPASTIYSSLLPWQPLYLAVGSSFEETGPCKFTGAPGNEGDVNRSAIDQKLCGWWVKE